MSVWQTETDQIDKRRQKYQARLARQVLLPSATRWPRIVHWCGPLRSGSWRSAQRPRSSGSCRLGARRPFCRRCGNWEDDSRTKRPGWWWWGSFQIDQSLFGKSATFLLTTLTFTNNLYSLPHPARCSSSLAQSLAWKSTKKNANWRKKWIAIWPCLAELARWGTTLPTTG